jgi:hypothetical protein
MFWNMHYILSLSFLLHAQRHKKMLEIHTSAYRHMLYKKDVHAEHARNVNMRNADADHAHCA